MIRWGSIPSSFGNSVSESRRGWHADRLGFEVIRSWPPPQPLAHVPLGVELRHIGFAMAEEDLGLLQAELLPDAGGVGVAELMGPPAVGLAPDVKLGLLHLRQAALLVGASLVVALGQRREGLVAGMSDRPAVAVRYVGVPG